MSGLHRAAQLLNIGLHLAAKLFDVPTCWEAMTSNSQRKVQSWNMMAQLTLGG